MKMMMKTMVAAVGIAAALTASAMTEAIAYYGNIQNADGKPFEQMQQMAMTFRIYDSMEPQTVLWARTIPVRVEIDGSFYAELSDEKGEVPGSGAPAQKQPLARVCANAEGNIQIGLTPPGSSEFSPRQTLSTYPAADYAVYAKGAPKATFSKPLVTDTVTVKGKATVVGDLTVGFSDSEFLRKPITIEPEAGAKEVTLTGKKIVFVDGVKGWTTITDNPAAWAEKGPDRVISRHRDYDGRWPEQFWVALPFSEVKGYDESANRDDVDSVQAF